jgi:hypothetical protein
MAVLPGILDVEHDGAALPYQIEAALGGCDEIEVLVAGEAVFGRRLSGPKF